MGLYHDFGNEGAIKDCYSSYDTKDERKKQSMTCGRGRRGIFAHSLRKGKVR